MWSSCDSVTLDYYSQFLDSLLCNIPVPFSALGSCSSDLDCLALIDQFYVDIFHASLMLLCSVNVNVNVNQKISVARIAELSRSPRGRSRVTELYEEKIDEKGMFLDVDERHAETEMIGCQMSRSSRGEMQRLEMSVDRRL